MPNDLIALPRYDGMCVAIAACREVDEAKDLRDQAESLRAYAKQANNRAAEVDFAEIKVRAEIRCGELLRELQERGQRSKRGQHPSSDRVSLDSLGIDPKESERFQQQAAVPRVKIETAFAMARTLQVPLTSASIRALGKPILSAEQRAAHERLWRVLRALEQISDQDVTPESWINALPAHMVERFKNHLARARPWLERLFKTWDVTLQ